MQSIMKLIPYVLHSKFKHLFLKAILCYHFQPAHPEHHVYILPYLKLPLNASICFCIPVCMQKSNMRSTYSSALSIVTVCKDNIQIP